MTLGKLLNLLTVLICKMEITGLQKIEYTCKTLRTVSDAQCSGNASSPHVSLNPVQLSSPVPCSLPRDEPLSLTVKELPDRASF